VTVSTLFSSVTGVVSEDGGDSLPVTSSAAKQQPERVSHFHYIINFLQWDHQCISLNGKLKIPPFSPCRPFFKINNCEMWLGWKTNPASTPPKKKN
jgi:hypothetical protein